MVNKYTIEIDNNSQNEWYAILELLSDSNIYQSWSYGKIRWGENKLSHLILKKDNVTIGAVQVIIRKLPIFNTGVAFIRWGPMFRLSGENTDILIFKRIVDILVQEYVKKRGLILRIFPNIVDDKTRELSSILPVLGFKLNKLVRNYHSFLIDLSKTLIELRSGLDQKWRNRLNKAEKNGLKIKIGTDIKFFDIFLKIYKEMHVRKKFTEFINVDEFRKIQIDLPDKFKMVIMICEYNNKPVSGIVCSIIGDTAVYLLGATSNYGLKLQGSYLLQWKMIEFLKENKYQKYDLGGINPLRNPGTYHFKKGLCGKNGQQIQFIGTYDKFNNFIQFFMIKVIDFIKSSSHNSLRLFRV